MLNVRLILKKKFYKLRSEIIKYVNIRKFVGQICILLLRKKFYKLSSKIKFYLVKQIINL